MGTLLAAVAFLTRIPVPAAVPAPGALGAAAFGLVGAGMGLVAAIPLLLLGDRAPWVAALLAVAVLAILSGGLHLDGLADTADALVAPGGERAERARKDPAIGAAGAVALILVIGLEAGALAQLATAPAPSVGLPIGPVTDAVSGGIVAAIALVVAAAWGRAMAVVVAVVGRRLAGTEGLAAGFVAGVRPGDAVLAAAAPLAGLIAVALWTASVTLVVGLITGLVASAVLAGLVVRARSRLDGDGLGATVQLAEAAVVASTAIVLAAFQPRPL